MEDKIKKLYKLLDLEPGASIENVKRAFKELSHIWHPDNHFKKSEGVQARAEEKFKEISQAYQELKEHLGKEDRSVQEEREAEETRRRKEEEARQERDKESRRAEEQKELEKREQREREERDRKIRKEREENIRKKAEQSKREHQEKERKFWEIVVVNLVFFAMMLYSFLTGGLIFPIKVSMTSEQIGDIKQDLREQLEIESAEELQRPSEELIKKARVGKALVQPINKHNKAILKAGAKENSVPPQGAAQMLSDLPEKVTREQNKVSSLEELAKKMTDYYKSASDQEIDKFIIGQTNAKKSVLPQKLNKSITLYKIEYLKDKNTVGYAYEVSADNLGLTEKELIADKQTVTYNLREHHKRYFCTSPSIRMELDIGIDFLINIISENSNYVGSYQISKGDCVN